MIHHHKNPKQETGWEVEKVVTFSIQDDVLLPSPLESFYFLEEGKDIENVLEIITEFKNSGLRKN